MWPSFLTPKRLRSDHILAVLVDENNRERGGMVKVKDGAFAIGETRYIVDHRVMTRTGIFRTPTCYYIAGNAGPIDLRGNVTITLDGDEEFIRMESHVASDALKELGNDGLFSNGQLVMLLILVGAIGFLWWNLNGKIDEKTAELTTQLTRIEQRSAPSSGTPLVPFNP